MLKIRDNLMEATINLQEYLKNTAEKRKSLICQANQHLNRILVEEEKKSRFVKNQENSMTHRQKFLLAPIHKKNSKSFSQSNLND